MMMSSLNSNFNLDAIRDKLRQFLEPKKEESKPIESIEENIDDTLVEIEEEEEIQDEMSEFEEKSVVTLGEIINPIENDDEDIE